MSLNKYEVTCDNCGDTSLVLAKPESPAPQFCPMCGTALESEEEQPEEQDQ